MTITENNRAEDIYFASQDVLVMENIEDLQPAMEACNVKPELTPTVRAMKNWINIVAQRILSTQNMVGAVDMKYEQNLYVDGSELEVEKLKLIWLDPIA